MADLYCGFWTMEDLKNAMTVDKIFISNMSNDQREERYNIWTDRVNRYLNTMHRN